MTRQEAIDKVYGMSGTKEQHEALEFLIPEVRELREFYERQQEDKRIRKELVEAFEALDIDSSWNGIPVKSILAWLKDQKPAEWSEEDKDMLGKVLECIRFAEDHYQLEQEETNGVAVKWWLLDHIIPQPKVEWSEEDKAELNNILAFIKK